MLQVLRTGQSGCAKSQGLGVIAPTKLHDLANQDVVIARVHQLLQFAVEPCQRFSQASTLTGLALHRHPRKAGRHVPGCKLACHRVLLL